MKFLGRSTRAIRAGFITIGMVALVGSAITLSFAGDALSAQATVDLGNVDSFGALSFTAMTNAVANTVVNGNIGSSTSIDAGVTHPGFAAYGAGSPELADAQAASSPPTAPPKRRHRTSRRSPASISPARRCPGVYNSTSGILISGPIPLTLDGGGDPNSVFIFQAASSGDLTVDPTSSMTYTNGAQPCNVFWKVNSAFLKNTDHTFVGTILALTQITLTENITVEGRVLARNADVTFIHDTINKPTCATTPPPASAPHQGPVRTRTMASPSRPRGTSA